MKKLIGVTLALLVVLGLFAYTSTQKANIFTALETSSFHSTTPTPSQSPASVSQDLAPTKIINVAIKNRAVVGGTILSVEKNQTVVLQITSDRDDALSLVGYDKHVLLQKGKMVVLSFLATIPGTFSYQVDNPQVVLGSVVVSDK